MSYVPSQTLTVEPGGRWASVVAHVAGERHAPFLNFCLVNLTTFAVGIAVYLQGWLDDWLAEGTWRFISVIAAVFVWGLVLSIRKEWVLSRRLAAVHPSDLSVSAQSAVPTTTSRSWPNLRTLRLPRRLKLTLRHVFCTVLPISAILAAGMLWLNWSNPEVQAFVLNLQSEMERLYGSFIQFTGQYVWHGVVLILLLLLAWVFARRGYLLLARLRKERKPAVHYDTSSPHRAWVERHLETIAGYDSTSRLIYAGTLEHELMALISWVGFIASRLTLLGLIGTVIGFVIVFSGVDPATVSDVSAIGPTVTSMISGMAVALQTTMAGALLGGFWLSINYQIVKSDTTRLHVAIIRMGEHHAHARVR